MIRFDRGTILLEGDRERLEKLPGVLWDARVQKLRAPAFRYHDLAVELDLTRAMSPGSGPSVQLRAPELRHYQRAALTAWEVTGQRGVAVMPTGSGKTRVALGAIAKRKSSALVLVPTRALLDQWASAIAGFHDGPVGLLGDGRSRVELLTVCTFESANRQMERLGFSFALLVVDEVHHLGQSLRPEALEMCAAPARLGLTATPPAGRRLQRLEQLVGPVVSCQTVAELSGRHLAPHERVPILVPLTRDERRRYEEGFTTYLEACRAARLLGDSAGAARLVASSGGKRGMVGLQQARRALATAQSKLELAASLLARHRDQKVLLFTADTDSAYATSRRLLIPAITCDIRRRERDVILDRLRRGRCRAVVAAQVLNEGLDLPDCSVGIVLAASRGGERESAQRLGRLLRPTPGKMAVLYELCAERTFEVEHGRRRSRAQ